MFIVQHKKIFLGIATLLMLASVVSLFISGLNLSIDFTGGSVLEVSYTERPSVTEIQQVVEERVEGSVLIRPVGETGYSVRMPFVDDSTRQEVSDALGAVAEGYAQEKVSSVGPVISSELGNKALVAILIISTMIILFVAFAFRKVSKPVSAWWYGLIAIVALIHDVLIPVGVFSWFSLEVDVLFVTALLAILGYSVNDTIVVFDRVRERLAENKEKKIKETFEETVGQSVQSTIARSVNTSLTTLIVLSALLLVVGPAIHNFVIALIVGVIAGTYSSIFVASPLLVLVYEKFPQKKQEK